MASLKYATNNPEECDDNDTDYGSDFTPEQERIVERLLSGRIDIEDNPIVSDVEYHDPDQTLRVPRIFGREQRSILWETTGSNQFHSQVSSSTSISQYQDLSKSIKDQPTCAILPSATAGWKEPDTRSPLERYRTQPKKPLSVTDLVSPAWCELQYWYSLTRHGKKKRTPAMKQGSAIHKVLEDQVHTTVKIETQSKEDAWGLRIWNVIQGLRTLRNTGQTRELEVWGTINGLVVNGVIDELSYICPDSNLEKSMQAPCAQDGMHDQTTIADFFKSQAPPTSKEVVSSSRDRNHEKIYVCDVKTRGVNGLPSGAALRPSKMQLMLYHRLLSSLAGNMVDFSVLTTRYNLDPTKMFSDTFIAQIGSLHEDVFYDVPSSPEASQGSVDQWSQDSMTTLLAHNSLSALWSLMITEFQTTMPEGAKSLGDMLRVEYRSRDGGEIIGSKTFAMNHVELKDYVDHGMKWWKGEREAQGVPPEEAYKCRNCEFTDGCEWRLKKVDEAKGKFRISRKSKGSA